MNHRKRKRQQAITHTPKEIEGIRSAAHLAAEVRKATCQFIAPGMSTFEVDRHANQLIEEAGAKSAFHNYRGFPGHICISLNEEIVHGIGSTARIIQTGDVISLDVGVILDNYYGDNAQTITVGPPRTHAIAKLIQAGKEALNKAICTCLPGNHICDIGKAVESTAQAYGFSIVKDFVGHGCGCELHESPEVPNFSTGKTGPRLREGMVLAIEPMLNIGTADVNVDHNDKWTVRTADLEVSVHFEEMVLIQNPQEPEILTWPRMP